MLNEFEILVKDTNKSAIGLDERINVVIPIKGEK